MFGRTIPDFAAGRSRQRIRELSDYQENLRNLRSILRNENASPEEVFDAFEDVLESFTPLAEEVREQRIDQFDEIMEELEEERERFEETGVVPRPRWFAAYDQEFVSQTSLDRHHGVLERVFGLWAAGTLSSDTSYRLEAYLDSMERVFPEVARELLEPADSHLHNLRYYNPC